MRPDFFLTRLHATVKQLTEILAEPGRYYVIRKQLSHIRRNEPGIFIYR